MSAPAYAEETTVQLTCFLLDGDIYAVDIMRIKEIIQAQRIRPVPQAPRYIQGVINLRGTVIPVVDLRERFGLARAHDLGLAQRVVITSVGGRIVGLQVDAVTEILKLRNDQIVRVPSLMNRRETAYVLGIAIAAGDMVLILNMDRILSSEEAIDVERLRRAAFESADLEVPEGGAKPASPVPANPADDARQLAGLVLQTPEPFLQDSREQPEPPQAWFDEATEITENSQIANREKAAKDLSHAIVEPDEPAVVATSGQDEGERDDKKGAMSVQRAMAKRKKKKSGTARKKKS